MNFRTHRSRRATVVLEVTPLVDIVFLLLIFFLLTATYVKNPTIDINLPKASMQQTARHTKDLMIAIKKDGSIRFDNEQISVDKLEGLLSAAFAENEDSIVVVRADEKSLHGRVVEVMDLAKKVGFAKLAIAIEGRAAPEAE